MYLFWRNGRSHYTSIKFSRTGHFEKGNSLFEKSFLTHESEKSKREIFDPTKRIFRGIPKVKF